MIRELTPYFMSFSFLTYRDTIGNLFIETDDFLTQYCCVVLTGLQILKSGRRRPFATKFWPGVDMKLLSFEIANISSQDSVNLMQWMTAWNQKQGRESW
jgi:hypothetical protein